MLRALTLLAVGLVGTTSADEASIGDSLRALIQERVGLALNAETEEVQTLASETKAINCAAGQNLFCPLANPPDVVFPADGGSMTTSASSCCPNRYLQCQVQQGQQYCRVLGYYTITPPEANNQEVCPPTTPDCTCQAQFNTDRALRLRFCPSVTPCCPRCECWGDPHCRSFSQSQAMWAVCDSRDSACVHNYDTCSQQTYKGKQCVWNPPSSSSIAYCGRPDPQDSPSPTMVMYRKTYRKYFNPGDNTDYEFRLVLTLGTYGSITRIEMTDTGTSPVTYAWFIQGNQCRGNSAFPFNGQGIATISGLTSMVNLQLSCKAGGGRSPTSGRIDVLKLQDPWWVPNGRPNEFGGYCATGIIAEAAGETLSGGCNTVDRQLSLYFGCSPRTDINVCKKKWCNDNYAKLSYATISPGASTVAQRKNACTAWVTSSNPSQVKNFMAATCAVSNAVAAGVYPQDPTKCADDDDCKSCMDNVLDFPEEIATIFQGEPVVPPPAKVCGDLLQLGLARQSLPIAASGIEIDFQPAGSQTWSPVFALLNSEIEQCDCASIYVNGTAPANIPLVRPGKYRIQQCNGLNTSPNQDMCTSAPAYNASVVFSWPQGGEIVSQPFGRLYDKSVLVCNRQLYPGCPPDYPCCIWSTKAGWVGCMIDTYKADYATKYPTCQFKP